MVQSRKLKLGAGEKWGALGEPGEEGCPHPVYQDLKCPLPVGPVMSQEAGEGKKGTGI